MKACLVDNCPRTFYAKGLCKFHYDREYRRHVALDAPYHEKLRLPKGTPCRVDGCHGKIKAQGYCKFHYARYNRGLDLQAPSRGFHLAEDGTKYCRSCGKTKNSNDFFKDIHSSDGIMASCKTCRFSRRDWQRNKLKTHYNMTLEEYDVLLAKQNGVCAICGQKEKIGRSANPDVLSVDHNHTTEAIRGLLCRNCNSALGLFKDDLNILESAVRYMRKDSA